MLFGARTDAMDPERERKREREREREFCDQIQVHTNLRDVYIYKCVYV